MDKFLKDYRDEVEIINNEKASLSIINNSLYRINFYIKHEKYKMAFDECQKVIRINPVCIKAYKFLAFLYKKAAKEYGIKSMGCRAKENKIKILNLEQEIKKLNDYERKPNISMQRKPKNVAGKGHKRTKAFDGLSQLNKELNKKGQKAKKYFLPNL
jgi:hypothetical protein